MTKQIGKTLPPKQRGILTAMQKIERIEQRRQKRLLAQERRSIERGAVLERQWLAEHEKGYK